MLRVNAEIPVIGKHRQVHRIISVEKQTERLVLAESQDKGLSSNTFGIQCLHRKSECHHWTAANVVLGRIQGSANVQLRSFIPTSTIA
ncbi:unnamed protein product [Caenorhabditis brenneri]